MEQLAESKFTSRRGDPPIITVKNPKSPHYQTGVNSSYGVLTTLKRVWALDSNKLEAWYIFKNQRNFEIEWKCNKLHIHLKPGRPPLQTYGDLASWNIICCCSTTKSRSGRCHLSRLAAASSFPHCTAAQLQQPWPRRTACGDGGRRPGTHRQGVRKASRPSSSRASQTRSTTARP